METPTVGREFSRGSGIPSLSGIPAGPQADAVKDAGHSSRASVALVHEWLVDFGGSEATLLHFLDMFPDAPLHLLFWDRAKWRDAVGSRRVETSFLQKIPAITRNYRYLLPLFPSAAEAMRVQKADLMISSSHAVAKAMNPPAGAFHLCYCYTPMRYIYDQSEVYLKSLPIWARPVARATFDRIRPWDIRTASRVNRFVAISKFVASRIQNYYHRDADVIYPPVDTEFFVPAVGARGDYFLLVSRLVPYKNIEVAIEAFRRTKQPLKIVGKGPMEATLKRQAPANVDFLGSVSRETLRGLYRGARALVFTAVEDFGIAPVEAMACGTPVIALEAGGALETVSTGVSGSFYQECTPESLAAALQEFETQKFEPAAVRAQAEKFSASRFRREFKAVVADCGFDV